MNKEELIQELKNLKGGQWTEKSADAIAAVLDEYIDNQGSLSYNNVSDVHIDSLPEETSEDLEEAAAQYAKYTAAPPSDVAYHFVAGVSWQRNRVWHDIDEKPNMRKFVVFSDGKKSMTPPLRNMFDDYPMLIDAANRKYGGGYKVWAYAEDLLPNKEGEK